MPQVPESLDPKAAKGQRQVEIEWLTISYRTIWTVVGLLLAVVIAVTSFVYPDAYRRAFDKVLGETGKAGDASGFEQKQARFLNIEGTVRVKKANAIQWVNANPSLTVEKGDVIQTANDSGARVLFADGSSYQLKPDTLVVIEENSASARATNVQVQVTSGEVDLSTSKFEGESKVTFANAVARVGQDTRANVRRDPNTQTSALNIRAGVAEVRRGNERVTLGALEQVTLHADRPMVREQVAGPPVLLIPGPQAPVVPPDPAKSEVTFSWKPVPQAKSYRIRVANSPIFSTILYDRKVTAPPVRVAGLAEGRYWWAVASVDDQGKESQVSDASRFDLILKAGKDEILLEVNQIIQHGRRVQITGRTEPGATVLVNNERVFSVDADGTFKHFTQEFPSAGANQVTVTAQNSKGQIATKRKTVYIQ